jgi:hypothetical protein
VSDERPKKKRLRKIADSDSESIYNNGANDAVEEVSESAKQTVQQLQDEVE